MWKFPRMKKIRQVKKQNRISLDNNFVFTRLKANHSTKSNVMVLHKSDSFLKNHRHWYLEKFVNPTIKMRISEFLKIKLNLDSFVDSEMILYLIV